MTFDNRKLTLPCLLASAPLNAILAVAAQTSGGADGMRPNIILFMVDDMGWQDTSVPFWTQRTPLNNTYETPNMERLASEGMLFTQAYAAPISSPSRCSLMTGSNAARHRVTNWTLRRNESTDVEDAELTMPKWNVNGIIQTRGGMQNAGNFDARTGLSQVFVCRSFVDILHESGYHTIHIGKAHWGAEGTAGERPEHFGFDVNIAGHAAGGLATYLSEQNYGHDSLGRALSPMATPDLERYWGTGTFLTEALTQEALHALDSWKSREHPASDAQPKSPFYLYMSHYAVHIPIDRDPRFYQKYIGKGLSTKEAAYASLIEGMDYSLGELLRWLDRNGEAENTIVIFMSDNGGYATGSYYREEPLYTQNAPLRSGKGSLLEGGIREPMIVRWPGRVRPKSRCNNYLMIEDFFPTMLKMADIDDYDVPQTIDGRSFLPLLTETGNPSRKRSLIWNYPNVWGNEGPGISLNCAIRRGPWKLIYNYKTHEKELYNIETDISELHNLAKEQPKLVRKLSRELGRQLRKMNAQRPSVKVTGKPCPWPDEVE
ncbi:MAG: sulfatase [Prevotella sp.]|nr:sulfatase [Prevotella sp.]